MSVDNQGMISGIWFAVLRKANGLPVLFSSEKEALDNLDHDEYMVPVVVHALKAEDTLRGMAAVRRLVEPPGRPHVPLQKKRRRGAFRG